MSFKAIFGHYKKDRSIEFRDDLIRTFSTREEAQNYIDSAFDGRFKSKSKNYTAIEEIPEILTPIPPIPPNPPTPEEDMSVLSKLKGIFLPSPEVGAERRQKTFGTESKAAAATAILGTAALAVTPLGALKKGATAIGSALGSAFLKAPVKTSAAVLGTSAVVAGGGLKLIPPAFSATKKATSKVVKKVTENEPFLPTDLKDVGQVAGAVVGSTIVGAGLGYLAGELLDDDGKKTKSDDKVMGTDSSLPTSGVAGGSLVSTMTPVTPATQIVSSSRSVSKRRKKAKLPSVTPPVRINILNQLRQTTNVGNRRFINY